VAKRRRSPVGHTIGGILVGFDEQVLRRLPPAQEVVAQVDRARTVVPGTGLIIEFPDPSMPDPLFPVTQPEADVEADPMPS
jgi:hypothetical protein